MEENEETIVVWKPRPKPWSVQRSLQTGKIPSRTEIRAIAYKIEDLRERCLFIITYITAGRISEIVKVCKKKDFDKLIEGDREIIKIQLPNRKHKKKKYKEIPVSFEKDGDLLEQIELYLSKLDYDDPLFPFSRTWAYMLIRKNSGFNCHFLRHVRLTHLITEYKLDAYKAQRFAGHSDLRPMQHYLELRWDDIAKDV